MTYRNQQWILKKRPVGLLKEDDLELSDQNIEEIKDGECLIKVKYIPMNPATRGFLSERGSYLNALNIGEPVLGRVAGRVIESKNDSIEEGLIVVGFGPWAKYIVARSDEISPRRTGDITKFAPLETLSGHALPMYLHALGTSGGTAYQGLVEIADMKKGDTVLVSAAAGSVGSLACQFATLKGASKVVGIAGGSDKCREVLELYGADACIDYKSAGNLSEAIAEEFPNGLNVYFDNVGGETLEAALDNLADNARIAVCGMISQYNAVGDHFGVRNLWNLLVRQARMEGFLFSSYFGRPECDVAFKEISEWLTSGKLNALIDERNLFEDITQAYNLLFSGGNRGRLLVRVPD